MNLLIAKDVPIQKQNVPVSKTIALLQSGNDIIIIVNDSLKFEGVIRTRNVIGKGLNPSASCKNYLDRNIPTLFEKELLEIDPFIIGEMMIDGMTRYIPILDNHSKVKGAFKDATILSNLISNREDYEQLTAKNVINWNLVYLTESDSIGTAIAKIREYGFSRIPVLSSLNKFEGLIIDRSLLRTHVERRVTSGDIGGGREKTWYLGPAIDFLSPAEFISPTTPILEVIDKFVNYNCHSFFVKDSTGNCGIITSLDIIQFILKQRKTINFNVQVMEAPDEDVHDHAVRKSLNILEREQNWLGTNSIVRIRFKRNLSQSKRGQFSITTMVRLNSEKGFHYSSESTDFGAEKTMNKALDNLSRIISNDKKRRHDRKIRGISKRKMYDVE